MYHKPAEISMENNRWDHLLARPEHDLNLSLRNAHVGMLENDFELFIF